MEVPSFTTGSKPNETVSKNLWKGSGVELSIHARTHCKQNIMDCTKLWAVKVLVFHKQYLEWCSVKTTSTTPGAGLSDGFLLVLWIHFDSFHPAKSKQKLQAPCLAQHGMTWSHNFSYFQFLVLVKIWHTQYYKCNKWIWRIFFTWLHTKKFPKFLGHVGHWGEALA